MGLGFLPLHYALWPSRVKRAVLVVPQLATMPCGPSRVRAPSWRCHRWLPRPPGTRGFGPTLRSAPQPLRSTDLDSPRPCRRAHGPAPTSLIVRPNPYPNPSPSPNPDQVGGLHQHPGAQPLTLALTLASNPSPSPSPNPDQVLSLYGLRSSLETAGRAHGGRAAAQGGGAAAQGSVGRGQGGRAGVQRGGGAAAQGGGVGAQGGGAAAQGGGATAQGEQRRVCVALLSIQVRSSGGGRRLRLGLGLCL